MPSKKKRTTVQLPIPPDAFAPYVGVIKSMGRDVGAEALDCLKERYAAEVAYLTKLSTQQSERGKGKQS